MRKKMFVSLFIILLVPSLTIAETAVDAYKALKKLEAHCQTGISYIEYRKALAEPKYVVNMFLESEEAKQKPELTISIMSVIHDYETAGDTWKMQFAGSRKTHFIDVDSDIGKLLLKIYPEANKDLKDGGAIVDVRQVFRNQEVLIQKAFGNKVVKINIDAMVKIIWQSASKKLAEIKTMLDSN